MSHYQQLEQHYRKLSRFAHLGAICGWDQAAMMPAGGAQARQEAMAELAVLMHQLATAPELAERFAAAEQEQLSQGQRASLAAMQRDWQQQTLLPEKLVAAKSLAGSKCEHAWRSQRPANDWSGFLANWREVVALSREEAQLRAAAQGCSPYDAMVDLYEPGMSSAQLDDIFGQVKRWLPSMIDQAVAKQANQALVQPSGHYPASEQKALGTAVMQLLQFDFTHGRLDESTHPFCGGVPTDVRMTTRYSEQEFVQSLMGIVHETGHGRYEQGLPQQWAGLPVGRARSMGIHESQSLFFEMQLGRSPEFIAHLAQLAQQHFSQFDPQLFSVANLQGLYSQVQKGYIRVDADELTYPAHVMLRYEIERDLINGQIEPEQVPELWDHKMQQYLGLSTAGNDRQGCMQDIHWTDGAFGYFPSYSLGAMYAAQFMASIRQQLPVSELVAKGELGPIFAWLADNIWSQASLHSTSELVIRATGQDLNPEYLRQHLQQRYL